MLAKRIPKKISESHVNKFWDRVTKTATCWLWTGELTGDGYGRFHMDNNNRYRAHRVSYVLAGKELSPKDLLRHKCDNPACVRPSHLKPVDKAQNAWDAIRKGRDTTTITLHKQTSKYRGVWLNKNSNKWMSRITSRGVSKYLGTFKNEKDAANAYNKAARKIHGRKAVLNVV
jgi:hypothetical protein